MPVSIPPLRESEGEGTSSVLSYEKKSKSKRKSASGESKSRPQKKNMVLRKGRGKGFAKTRLRQPAMSARDDSSAPPKLGVGRKRGKDVNEDIMGEKKQKVDRPDGQVACGRFCVLKECLPQFPESVLKLILDFVPINLLGGSCPTEVAKRTKELHSYYAANLRSKTGDAHRYSIRRSKCRHGVDGTLDNISDLKRVKIGYNLYIMDLKKGLESKDTPKSWEPPSPPITAEVYYMDSPNETGSDVMAHVEQALVMDTMSQLHKKICEILEFPFSDNYLTHIDGKPITKEDVTHFFNYARMSRSETKYMMSRVAYHYNRSDHFFELFDFLAKHEISPTPGHVTQLLREFGIDSIIKEDMLHFVGPEGTGHNKYYLDRDFLQTFKDAFDHKIENCTKAQYKAFRAIARAGYYRINICTGRYGKEERKRLQRIMWYR